MENSIRALGISAVVERTGLSKSTLRRLERAGKFPRRRSLSPARVAWISTEIEQWLTTREASE